MDDPSQPLVWDDEEDAAYHHGARRAHRRWQLHAEVDLESEDAQVSAVTLNVSAGGLRVASADPLPAGPVTLNLRTQDELRRIEGEVVWQRAKTGWWVAGVRFASPVGFFSDEATFVATSLPLAA